MSLLHKIKVWIRPGYTEEDMLGLWKAFEEEWAHGSREKAEALFQEFIRRIPETRSRFRRREISAEKALAELDALEKEYCNH